MNTGKGRNSVRCSSQDEHARQTYPDNSGADLQWMELARAYIKIQQYRNRWEPLPGLFKGTIFPELYRPYQPFHNGDDGSTEAMTYRERPMHGDEEEMQCRENACRRRSSAVSVRGGKKVEKR